MDTIHGKTSINSSANIARMMADLKARANEWEEAFLDIEAALNKFVLHIYAIQYKERRESLQEFYAKKTELLKRYGGAGMGEPNRPENGPG